MLVILNVNCQLISGKDGYDFKSVKRWTSQRKLGYGLRECDKVIIWNKFLIFVFYVQLASVLSFYLICCQLVVPRYLYLSIKRSIGAWLLSIRKIRNFSILTH